MEENPGGEQHEDRTHAQKHGGQGEGQTENGFLIEGVQAQGEDRTAQQEDPEILQPETKQLPVHDQNQNQQHDHCCQHPAVQDRHIVPVFIGHGPDEGAGGTPEDA